MRRKTVRLENKGWKFLCGYKGHGSFRNAEDTELLESGTLRVAFFSLANAKREIDEIKKDNYDDNDDDKCDRREGKRDHNFELAQKENSHV